MALEGPGYYWFGLITWTLSGCFGLWITARWIRERPTRILGMVIALTGMGGAVTYLGLLEQSAYWSAYWARVLPYFLIGPTFLWVYFISVYPRTRLFARNGILKALLVVLATVPVLAYMGDKSLWGTHDGPGPLFVFESGLFFGGSLLAAVLARDYHLAPPGPSRRSHFLLATGFATFGSVHAMEHLVIHWPSAASTTVAWMIWGVAAINLMLLATFWSHLALDGLRNPASEMRTRLGLFAGAPVLGAVVGSTIGILTRSDLSRTAVDAANVILDSATCLLFILILVYGQTKYRLFNVDLRIKWTLNRGTIAAAFVAVFFVVSEVAKDVFSTQAGPVAGLAAAGLLVFALAPLQRFAERWTDVAMPQVDRSSEYQSYRKLQMYRAAYESAVEEGGVSPKERQTLARLASKLGIGPADRSALEREVLDLARAA